MLPEIMSIASLSISPKDLAISGLPISYNGSNEKISQSVAIGWIDWL